MVDRDVVEQRLARLEQLVRHLRGLAETERQRFLTDVGLQAQAERWLHLAAECALDLANHLIADGGWKTPTTYRESFDTLTTEGVIGADLGAALQKWAGLRNILVHLYLDVDHAILFDIISNDLGDLDAFAAAVTSFIAE